MFIIERLFSQGKGDLQAEYERIKADLLAKGYFDEDHKQPLPAFPWTVGVLTSKTGAVLHDIHKIAAERNPYIPIKLFPIPVQGEGADAVIAETLAKAGKAKDIDVLILARGGGSMEDLWCFNSPAVVEAIYNVPIPIITAIGHETDTTLADYASDVRAATPTHAAELAFPDMNDMEMDIASCTNRAYELMQRHLDSWHQRVTALSSRLQPAQYDHFLAMKGEHVQQLTAGAVQRLQLRLEKEAGALGTLQGKLQALNPAALIRKGYGQLTTDGVLITTVTAVKPEQNVVIQLLDGTIMTKVIEVRKNGKSLR